MSDYARSLRPQITHQVVRLQEKDLLEGAMAAGALVALADQRISVEESMMVQTVVTNAEALQLYDPELALSLYTRHVEALREDYENGRARALEAIERCAEDIDAALLIVQVGIAIAKADKVFAASELSMIEEICERVGIEGLDTLGLAGVEPKHVN